MKRQQEERGKDRPYGKSRGFERRGEGRRERRGEGRGKRRERITIEEKENGATHLLVHRVAESVS